jgi:hypothetical protein
MLSLPVSLGEALDKLTILQIKKEKILDSRQADVVREFDMLYDMLKIYVKKYTYHYRILYEINLGLWNLQDKFHLKETSPEEGSAICKTILLENDRRFRVKAKINTVSQSLLKEQKGYIAKKVFLYSHLGLGDMFWMNGAVRYLATEYDEVVVVCKRINQLNVKAMYADDPTIKLYLINTDKDLYPWDAKRQIFIDQGYTVIGCGLFSTRRLPVYNLPLSFYDDISLPHHVRNTYFHVPETVPETVPGTLLEPIGQPYIVVHEQSSTLRVPIVENLKGETRLILDLSKNNYSKEKNPVEWEKAEKVINKPILEYAHLLQNAEELHLVESSIYCFASHLDLSKVSKKICYEPWDGNAERLGVFTTGPKLETIPIHGGGDERICPM